MTLTTLIGGGVALIALATAYRLYETRNDAAEQPQEREVAPVKPEPKPKGVKRFWAIPLAVFVIVEIGLNILIETGGCNDGWASSSIGRMGACSHHGGVNHNGSLILLCALVCAGVAFYLVVKADDKQ